MDTSLVSADAQTHQKPILSDTADSSAGVAPGDDVHPAIAIFEQMAENNRIASEAAKANESLSKALRKELKKTCKKRRKPSGTPSNLTKPIPLSDELCDFLKQERGTRLPRGQVTSMVNKYATDHDLKKEGNGRIIVVDGALAGLLGLALGDEVQIFRVPTHLKTQNHYIKEEASAS